MTGVNCPTSACIVFSCRIVPRNVTTFIGHQILISDNENAKIAIGNYVDIAPHVIVIILNGIHDIDIIGPHSAAEGKSAPAWIQDGGWIGANSTILPEATIGRKSIIGAGSVVVSDIPAFCVVVGNPCRPIKFWSRETGQFELVIGKQTCESSR